MSRPVNQNACAAILERSILAYSAEYPIKYLVLREITVIRDKMSDYEKTAEEWKQEDLKRLQDDFDWPFWSSQELMICIKKPQTGELAVLKKVDSTYFLVPGANARERFDIPKDARSGTREFLKVLIDEGWLPD